MSSTTLWPVAAAARVRPSGLTAQGISQRVRGNTLLDDISLTFVPGELVAIIGGSGAGKTTLLESLAGIRRATSGAVTLDGIDVTRKDARRRIGCVPQDDIIHQDLPLRRTLRYAARLRLPAGTARQDLELTVDRVLGELDLADRGDVRVRDLSGGQRKRASIAVELLTHPQVLFLDEPTSGLDPATGAEVLRVLRRVADHGTTVVLTSHASADVRSCDRVVVLARGGLLAFDGGPSRALAWFQAASLDELHTVVAAADPQALADRFRHRPRGAAASDPTVLDDGSGQTIGPDPAALPTLRNDRASGRPHRMAGAASQLRTLTSRSADLMSRARLTSAILIGSPTLVIAMLAILFRPGMFAAGDGDAIGAIQLVYWIAFAGFFFGLTYGLLQIVTESAILRRERFWGLSLPAYVASKLLVLLPLLIVVDLALFGVLRGLDRLPTADTKTWVGLAVVFLLDAMAGLALGLLASAAVTSAGQATLALPMLCFPQVLFAGAMVPVDVMTDSGRGISAVMSNRWAFEALGRVLDLDSRFTAAPDQLGAWASAFQGEASSQAAALALMVVACTLGTGLILRRRTAPG